MKKLTLLFLCVFLLAGAPARAEKDIHVYLNGNALTFDQQPVIKNDRTFVPVRKIFESFGMEVAWDGNTQQIYAYNDSTEILMHIGSDEMWVNGACIQLDVPPFLNGDRTFVPLRAISEALNCIVDWDGDNNSVIIIGNGSIIKPSAQPTSIPTSQPTAIPTQAPTAAPTQTPSAEPTTAPPSTVPTQPPAIQPTAAPTQAPTVQPTTAPTLPPSQSTSSETAMEQEVLRLVNQARQENGLTPLNWAEDLAAVARAHSRDMIDRSFFSHTNPDGLSPFDRLKNSGIRYTAAAENIAYGQKTAQAVMDGWMNSSGHRANILNKNVKEIGIGAVKNNNGTIYWTQVFVAR